MPPSTNDSANKWSTITAQHVRLIVQICPSHTTFFALIRSTRPPKVNLKYFTKPECQSTREWWSRSPDQSALLSGSDRYGFGKQSILKQAGWKSGVRGGVCNELSKEYGRDAKLEFLSIIPLFLQEFFTCLFRHPCTVSVNTLNKRQKYMRKYMKYILKNQLNKLPMFPVFWNMQNKKPSCR